MSNQTNEQIIADRAKSYGSAESSFGRIAALWSAYLEIDIEPHDVASMMSLLKISRSVTASGPSLIDSYQDCVIYTEFAHKLNPRTDD